MLIELFGFIFSIIIGTIGHFLYNLSYKNKVIGFFFSTNESVFQHLKLGITPIMLWITIELLTKNLRNVIFIKFISIVVFIIILLFLYRLYKTFTKKNILFLDIFIFYISLFFSYYLSILLFFNLKHFFIFDIIGIIGLINIIYCYIYFNKF